MLMFSPINRWRKWQEREIAGLRSIFLGSLISWRLNMRSCRIRVPAFSVADLASSNLAAAEPVSSIRSKASSTLPMMMASRLLKSWATPETNWPMASIF